MAIIDKLKKAVKVNEDDSEKVVSDALKKKEDKNISEKSIKSSEKKNVLYHSFISEPYITEKTSMISQENKYVFKVPGNINKIDIKRAVESIFDVTVVKVAVINTQRKKVRLGASFGRRPGFKKAIVKLKEGDKIDIGI